MELDKLDSWSTARGEDTKGSRLLLLLPLHLARRRFNGERGRARDRGFHVRVLMTLQ